MHIRQERRGDEVAIHDLTAVAFADYPHGDGSEPMIVKRLRDAGALHLSLVAEEAGEIHGHVAFSPITISGEDLGWLGLGPVSVLPARAPLAWFCWESLPITHASGLPREQGWFCRACLQRISWRVLCAVTSHRERSPITPRLGDHIDRTAPRIIPGRSPPHPRGRRL